jgi:hypothetical protein
MSAQLPPIRAEFDNNTVLARVGGLRRYEVEPPKVTGEIRGISEAVGCTHGPRASVIARVGGGHLRNSREELLGRLLEEARLRLDATCAQTQNASDQIAQLVSWLERERESGFLERAYITATIILAVSDDEVWTWLVSPHGLVQGTPDEVSATSTDLRYPVLRRLGLMQEPAFAFPGADAGDQATSIMCIGAPNGYESIRTRLARNELVIALDRGTLPFGPLPTAYVPLTTLWKMDAAWKHGLTGRAVALGCTAPDALRLPEGWQIKEIPLQE